MQATNPECSYSSWLEQLRQRALALPACQSTLAVNIGESIGFLRAVGRYNAYDTFSKLLFDISDKRLSEETILEGILLEAFLLDQKIATALVASYEDLLKEEGAYEFAMQVVTLQQTVKAERAYEILKVAVR